MAAYAEGTSVPIDRTIAALQSEVLKRGGRQFGYLADEHRDLVVFMLNDRTIRMGVTVPTTREVRYRTPSQLKPALAAEHRRRWRSLFAVVKAMLVAVDDGIITMSDAFLAYTVLPGGDTVGDTISTQLEAAGYAAPLAGITAARVDA